MSLLAEHLFSAEACERRREVIQQAVHEITEQHRQELLALLRRQHEALRLPRRCQFTRENMGERHGNPEYVETQASAGNK